MSNTNDHKTQLLAEYNQVCGTFRTLTDIRFKLLTLLPISAGAGVALSASSSAVAPSLPLATLGLVVSVALATYNARNDQHYDNLVGRAAHLEKQLGLHDGSFANRDRAWFRVGVWPVNHRWPISLVYASSAGAWLYIIVASIRGGARDTATAALAIALPATALAATHFLKKHRQNDMRADTFCAIDLATEESLTSATFWRFAWHACRVSGVWFWQRDAICRKAMSALKHWRAADSPLSAAHLFADIVDLSPRWIRRTASGQTGLIRPKSLAIAKQRAETQAKRLQESCDDPDVLSWLHQLDATAAEAPAAAPPQAVSAEAPSQ